MSKRDIEYLWRRCAINEEVLLALGNLVAAHLPAMQPYLEDMGREWDRAIDKIDKEFPAKNEPI